MRNWATTKASQATTYQVVRKIPRYNDALVVGCGVEGFLAHSRCINEERFDGRCTRTANPTSQFEPKGLTEVRSCHQTNCLNDEPIPGRWTIVHDES
jgi:hypothetical protein